MSSEKKELAIIRFLAGPFAGKEFPITKKSTSVGRSREADILVGDTLLSRKHAKIFLKDDKWLIEDLKSSNGTWIGGREIKEASELQNFQRVRAGNSMFEVEFRNQPKEEVDPSISYSFKPAPIGEDTSDLPLEDIRWQHRRLTVMYNLQNQLSLLLNENDIYSCVASALLGEIAADYIYMMVYDQKADRFVPSFGQDKSGKAVTINRQPISSSVLEYVKRKKEAVLSEDPPNDTRFASDSVSIMKTQTVICVPVISQSDMIGAIYMASVELNKKFTEEDLKLLAGVAFSSGMAIMNCRLIKKNIANERMAALGTTAASLSHYIKNILTGIDGCLYLMRMGIDDADPDLMNEAWGILSRNHKRLSGLVMDLLNLAKEHNLDLHLQNIGEIVLEAVELVKPNFNGMNIEVDLGTGITTGVIMAEVDAMAVHRVLLNLLNNSCDAAHEKYNGEPGGKVLVNASLTDNARILEMTIEDNGCGISADKVEQIFDMFYSGKGENGTGLGLAVSKRLVEAHKGIISVSSVENESTKFKIRLPIAHRTVETQLLKRPEID
ncbi:MAG: ATP-binding protein [Lentisphaerales bacterium]|nr:ATP-binding protein [Lentisphaerales bacterium]